MVTALNTALTAGARAGGDTSASVVVGRIMDGTTVVYVDQVLAASFTTSRRRLGARALAPTTLQVEYKAIFASPSSAVSFGVALAAAPAAFTAAVVGSLQTSGGAAFSSLTTSSMTTTVTSAPAPAAPAATPAEGLSTAGVIAIAVVLGGGGFILIICGYFCFCRGKKPADDDGAKDAPAGGLTVRAVGSSPRSPKVAPHSDA